MGAGNWILVLCKSIGAADFRPMSPPPTASSLIPFDSQNEPSWLPRLFAAETPLNWSEQSSRPRELSPDTHWLSSSYHQPPHHPDLGSRSWLEDMMLKGSSFHNRISCCWIGISSRPIASSVKCIWGHRCIIEDDCLKLLLSLGISLPDLETYLKECWKRKETQRGLKGTGSLGATIMSVSLSSCLLIKSLGSACSQYVKKD